MADGTTTELNITSANMLPLRNISAKVLQLVRLSKNSQAPPSSVGVRLRRDGRPAPVKPPLPGAGAPLIVSHARADALRGNVRRPRQDQARRDKHGLRHPQGAPPPQSASLDLL
ncbi:Os02g0302300 [Oryza sativa Japonica Group]|uniref:Os02g0302300 protein n=1 Tax=Oryza sativa subsp. japonica TaxID=39947 RepID=A0A0N7KF54_ORYSJ|nr:Os02g0302300 [Oryza sativa Japonica Group]